MKGLIAHLTKKRYFFLLFIFLEILIYYAMYTHRVEHSVEFLSQKSDFIHTQYKVVSNNHADIAEVIFKTQINKPEIIQLIKERKREELHEMLLANYFELRKFSIRQLHFHLPNNDSFLRMHRPKKFGDNLTDIRATVAYTNANKKYVSGFEEGKIFNGFRYVYPLFDKNEHIGSVEISFSALSFIKDFLKNYDVQSNFIIKKSIVNIKVFDDEKSNYAQSPFPNYYYQNAVLDFLKMDGECFSWSALQKQEIEKRIDSGEVFSMYDVKSREIVTFIPLKNPILNRVVGSFIFRSHDRNIYQEKVNFIVLFSVASVTVLLILILIYKDFLYKEDLKSQVDNRTQELLLLNEELEKMVRVDALTGAYNRRHFYDVAPSLIALSQRDKKNLCIAMMDIDKFKNINDSYGHDQGDEVLQEFVQIVQGCIRQNDLFVRFGGEEFVLLFTGLKVYEAYTMAQKIRKRIESHTTSQAIKFTVSIGCTEYNYEEDTIDSALKRADNALYKAKVSGRNQVVTM